MTFAIRNGGRESERVVMRAWISATSFRNRRRTVQWRSDSSALLRASSTVVAERNMIVLKQADALRLERLLVLAKDQPLFRRESHRLTCARHRCKRECTEHGEVRIECAGFADDAESRLHPLDAVGGEFDGQKQIVGRDESEFGDVVELVRHVHQNPVVGRRQQIECLAKLARLLREQSEEPLLLRRTRNDVEAVDARRQDRRRRPAPAIPEMF